MKPKKILIATAPFDGHFNPLTSIAMDLLSKGHDVRWYAGSSYAPKLEKLSIPHFPFRRAREVNQDNMNTIYPERVKLKGALNRIKFDLIHLFLCNTTSYFEDIQEIYHTDFAFDCMLCDSAFVALQLVKEKLGVPVFSFGIMAMMEDSRDVPPHGTAMTPASSSLGKFFTRQLNKLMNRMVLKESTAYYNAILTKYGLEPVDLNIFNVPSKKATLYLQSGVPGFEYYRSDLSPSVRFIGPLLPYKKTISKVFTHQDLLGKYEKVILISQGTVDNKQPEKLIIPSLEALKDKNYLLIVATGYSKTEQLRKLYPQKNILIEDFVDFDYLLPKVDLFICNGGYGSVMLSLSHGVPILAAGVHEGKNEICARIGYFNLGINLKKEKPTPAEINEGAEEMLSVSVYKSKVQKLSQEFGRYHPQQLCEQYIKEVLEGKEEAQEHKSLPEGQKFFGQATTFYVNSIS
jgi:MGT family glycosyltransferase